MLPKVRSLIFYWAVVQETSEVQALKEQWEYFTTQCYREMRRVTMMNYDMGREVLVNLGQMISHSINQMTADWRKFLDYYGATNQQRKAQDEQFLEDHGIKEEQEDFNPNEDDDG